MFFGVQPEADPRCDADIKNLIVNYIEVFAKKEVVNDCRRSRLFLMLSVCFWRLRMQLAFCTDERDPRMLILSFQQEFFRKVDRFLFQKEVTGKDFCSFQELQEWFFQLEAKIAKRIALQSLARRNYPKAFLAKKLSAKGLSDAVIAPLLDRLEKEGFIEESFSVEREVKKWARKGFGPLLIQYKLQSKGFDKELLLQSIHKFAGEDVQEEAIRSLLAKKKTLEKKKIASFLARRGYASSLIRKMLF
jgi:regulatory protein